MSGRLPAGTTAAAAGVLAGLLAVALAGVGQLETLVGGAGVLALAVAPVVSSGRLASLGGGALFGAILLAGLVGDAPAAALLGAGVATLLAWTWTFTAVGLGRQLGTADTGGLELTHVAGTSALGVGGGVVAFAAFDVGWVDLPPTALLAIVVGAAALVTALRRGP